MNQEQLLGMLVGMIVLMILEALVFVILYEIDRRKDRHVVWDEKSGAYDVIKGNARGGILKVKGKRYEDGFFVAAPQSALPHVKHPNRLFVWHHTGHPMVVRKRNGHAFKTASHPMGFSNRDATGRHYSEFGLFDASFYKGISGTEAIKKALGAYDARSKAPPKWLIIAGLVAVGAILILAWMFQGGSA